MKNRDLQATWTYHNGTKHSYESIRTNRHYLDWENQPIPFKIYSELEPIPLPQQLSSSGMTALEAISSLEAPRKDQVVPSIQTLAEILYLSAGITKRRSYPGGEILFRAAACTGALYHIDLYLVCGDLPGSKAGVYHFGPQDFALRRLRDGDYRNALVQASGREPAIVNAPVIIVCASTYWRNAWKYQSRAYRHCYWDTGTILANLLAAADARHMPARIVLGFVDDGVSRLLSLEPTREGALTLVALGNAPYQATGSSPSVDPLTFETAPLSKTEVDYPAIRAMHEASSLESEAEVIDWRGQTLGNPSTLSGRPISIAKDRLILCSHSATMRWLAIALRTLFNGAALPASSRLSRSALDNCPPCLTERPEESQLIFSAPRKRPSTISILSCMRWRISLLAPMSFIVKAAPWSCSRKVIFVARPDTSDWDRRFLRIAALTCFFSPI